MSTQTRTSPLRGRLDRATPRELRELAETLELKPLQGGAALESRIEVAYFDLLDRARPSAAKGALSYGAALATASLVMTPAAKAELVAEVRALARALMDLYTTPRADAHAAEPDDELENALGAAERILLDRAGDLLTAGKKPGEDPVQTGLKLAGAAVLPALAPGVGWIGAVALLKSSWHSSSLETLVRATLLTAGIGERLRLETRALTEH